MSKIIYIVDDQPGVLAALGHVVRRLDPGWKIREFSTPSDVIEAVRHLPPHLVLTDQTMPQMTGSQMLEIIRQIAPQTIRIIISGHATRTDKIGAAHQYLSKPFDHREVESRIRQALNAQESLNDPELARLVASLQSFPALPGVYVELLRELEKDDSTFCRIAELLNEDGGVLTRIIHLANSPLFRGNQVITRSSEALLQLGANTVKALVLSLHVFRSYNQIRFPEMPVESLWRHSWETSRLAFELCRKTLGDDAANDALFAGLVHDLGQLILQENQTEQFREVCRTAAREQKPLVEVQRQVFHASHAELSGFMLRLWGMPQSVIEAVTFHDAPWKSPSSERFSPTVALYMANILARQRNPPDEFVTPELNQEYLAAVEAPELTGRDSELLKT